MRKKLRTADVAANMALKVGVMGAASDVERPEHMEKAHALGQAAAEAGCVLLTGACPGLPLSAACGAKSAGGLVVGISAAMNLDEHITRYQSPAEFHDILVFTGSGLMGREVINIRSSDVVVIVGGRSGTLGELAIAYDEGKPIGIMTGLGGVGDIAKQILAVCKKDTGARVIYDGEPKRLILRLLKEVPRRVSLAAANGKPRGLVEDPVCHMRILPRAAVSRRVRGKVRYSFCSEACVQAFDAEPNAYTRPAARSARTTRRAKS